MSSSDPTRPGLGSDTAGESATELLRAREGERLGRYRLLRLVGRGGMGVVYRAHDPQLDRDVAIKILRVDKGGAGRARDRLLREAQAMAKISHPNVVPVFDVDARGSEVYVAMEFVAGSTLREWLRAQRRTAAQILDVFAQAGAGLEAAHAAGLVHRDFKPSNVLIDEHGRARVTDFGLVRAYDRATSSGGMPAPVSIDTKGVDFDASLTTTAVVMGTPGYMAPEQHAAAAVDHRADQFAFCVSLYEALYGRRPFPGKTVAEIARAKREAAFRRPPARRGVPAGVRVAIVRGLAPTADARLPSMHALLASLRPRSAGRRAALLAVAVGTPLTIAAAYLGRPADARCSAANLDGVWDEARREQVRDAFMATHAASAGPIFERTAARLDAYAARFTAMHHDVCVAAVDLDERMACLDARAAELEGLVEGLQGVDVASLERAFAPAEELPALDSCLAPRVREGEAPREVAARVTALHKELARARGLGRAGQPRAGFQLAKPVLATARELGFAPLHVEAAYRVGVLAQSSGEPREAAILFEEAALLGREAGVDLLAAEAAIQLVSLHGADLGDREQGRWWANEASALLLRVGSPPEQHADLEEALGELALAEGDVEAARGHAQAALDLRIGEYGPEHDLVGVALTNLGNVALRSGDPAAAAELYNRALVIREAEHGAEHPEVALLVHNLGITHWNMNEHDLATAHFRRALQIREATLGPDHPRVAATLAALGSLAQEQGAPQVALPLLVRAHEIRENVYGPTSAEVAASATGLGNVELEEGDLEGARDFYQTALAGYEAVYGLRHPDVAIALHNLGLVHGELGDHERAREYYARAVAVRRDLLPGDHPKLAKSRAGLGATLVELGREAEAVPILRDALAVRRPDGDPSAAAFTEFTLARALWPGEPGEAKALARDVLAGLDGDDPLRARVAAWLADR